LVPKETSLAENTSTRILKTKSISASRITGVYVIYRQMDERKSTSTKWFLTVVDIFTLLPEPESPRSQEINRDVDASDSMSVVNV